MKKIFCATFVLLSFCSFAQADANKIITEKVFTVNERVSLQMAFDSRLNELDLTDDQLYKYTTIIDDNVFYMIDYNRKGNKTMADIEKYMSKKVAEQNKTLKKLLSSEQYNKHLEIYQEVIITPIKNRLNTM